MLQLKITLLKEDFDFERFLVAGSGFPVIDNTLALIGNHQLHSNLQKGFFARNVGNAKFRESVS